MEDEVTSSPAQGTEGATVEPPSDFREYNRWRDSGELPGKVETTSAAAEVPPAKTEPDSETDDTQEPGETDEGAPARSKGGSRQRKIDRLTKENEELKRQMAERSVMPLEKPSQPQQSAAAGKPKLEDFRTLEDYQEALTDWKIDERERNRKQAEAKAAADAAVQKQQTDWADKEKAARKAHADYDDLMDTLQIPVSPGVMAARQAMLEDENGAELLYHLARNPKELERIASLPPASAVLAIGRLSASLDTPAPDNGKRRITGAPKPPPPSSRPSAGASKKDIHDEDFARSDYRGWSKEREAQLKG